MRAPALWTARSPRERAILGWAGAAVAALLAFALAWLPAERARARLGAGLPALRASVQEMRAQAEEVRALRALPSRAAAPATPLASLAASGALVQGLPGARATAVDAKRVRVAVDDASWARLLEWIPAVGAAHGLAVEEATVEALPAAGRVRASLVLATP
jgi:general secretion pathway protein M